MVRRDENSAFPQNAPSSCRLSRRKVCCGSIDMQAVRGASVRPHPRRSTSAGTSTSMLWFETKRITPGNWPFLTTTYAGLRDLKASLTGSVDLTEGNRQITITGCLDAYRRAILRRAPDLAQAVIASWNAGHPIGSVVCARALLETLATFHSVTNKAGKHPGNSGVFHRKRRARHVQLPSPSILSFSHTKKTRLSTAH